LLTSYNNNNNNNNNKIQAIGSLAVPVFRHSFGIINWHQEELQKLDRKTRKLLTIHGQHYPKADADRLYVPRKQGGRGLMQLEAAYAVEITKIGRLCRQEGRPPNTGCQNTPTQHRFSSVTGG